MGRTVLSAILATIAGAALSGCGTCFNCVAAYQHEPQEHQEVGLIYGGTRWGAEGIQSGAFRLTHPRPDDTFDQTAREFLDTTVGLVELPLCIAADTLTLPFTIFYTMQCRAVAHEQDRDASEVTSASR